MTMKMADVRVARRRTGPPGHDDPDVIAGAAPVGLARTPAAIVGLQRTAGNAAVARWLAESSARPANVQPATEVLGTEREHVVTGGGHTEQPATGTAATESPQATVVSATFADGSTSFDHRAGQLSDTSKSAKHEVAPTGTTSYDGAAAGSDCLPADILPADVDWDVVDKGKQWGVKVTAMRTSAQINVNPTPSQPATMTTPNTANPVDGGNIEDSVGSHNHWKFAISEMKGYHKTGGGRSAHWHSTAASDAHEYAHWNTDWLKNVLGGLWPQANRDIDKITIPKTSAVDEAAAKPLLKTTVDARIATANTKSTRDWNAVPDSAGMSGANGYKAGQRVLDGLIASVRDYAKSKKWK